MDGFSPCIDRAVADLWVLGPVRDQAPLHHLSMVLGAVVYDGQDLLGRRDIIEGTLRRVFVLKAEAYLEPIKGHCQGVTSAHGLTSVSIVVGTLRICQDQ